MMSPDLAASELHWRKRAVRLARRVNLGWWWHRLSPALVGVNVGGALMFLLFRQMRWPLETAAGMLIFSWLAAVAWAWWRARERFYTAPEGLLRLETHLGWNNVLSAAAAGGVPWPAPLAESVSALRWRWGPTTTPLAISAAVLFLGLWLPVGSPPKRPLPPPSQLPVPLQQVATWVDALKQQDLVEPTTMENWQDRLQELREKPAQDWYGQNGLEAAESLRNELSQDMDALGKNLQKASDMVSSLQTLPAGADAGNLSASLAQTLSDVQNGGLPLQMNLAQSMGAPLKLSPAQLQALQQQLQNGANALSGMQGRSLSGGHGGQSKIPRYWGKSTPGDGGPGGGGGTAPMSYNNSYADLKAGKSEGVSNPNLDHAALGDVVSEGSGGPPPPQPTADVDASTAGGAANVGTGGEAVFTQELTPQERAVLERYFK